jgi:hypothetical protein
MNVRVTPPVEFGQRLSGALEGGGLHELFGLHGLQDDLLTAVAKIMQSGER